MYGDSVPQSYSHPYLGITYNAPAVTGNLASVPGKFNIERLHKAKPAKAGDAKLRVKAALSL